MNVAELFACSGGMAEGLRRAGIPVSIAFDYDTDACDSYEANHGYRPIQIDARDLLRMVDCMWAPGSHYGRPDLLVADPPCTPWSRAGKRLGTADDRDMLAVTIEIIKLVRPRAYLIANVPGLDDQPNWHVVQDFLGELEGEGYCVRDFTRLDAADYGVPQHRVRPFWFGHQRHTECIHWPARTHGSPEECRQFTIPGLEPLKPWVTCRDALRHLPPEDLGSPVRLRWRAQNGSQHGSVPDRPARVVCTSSLGDGNVLAGPNHRPSREDAPARTLTGNTHGDGSLLALPNHGPHHADEPANTLRAGDGGGAIKCLEWPWDRPATTTTTTDRLPAPGHHGGSMLSQPNAVKLSERAAAILQGFPEGWKFCGKTKRARWAQIGMAMPPPLAEAVARSVVRQFDLARGEWDRDCKPSPAPPKRRRTRAA